MKTEILANSSASVVSFCLTLHAIKVFSRKKRFDDNDNDFNQKYLKIVIIKTIIMIINAGDRFTWSKSFSALHSGRRFTSHGVQNKFKIKVNILHCRDSKMMAAIKLKSLII